MASVILYHLHFFTHSTKLRKKMEKMDGKKDIEEVVS